MFVKYDMNRLTGSGPDVSLDPHAIRDEVWEQIINNEECIPSIRKLKEASMKPKDYGDLFVTLNCKATDDSGFFVYSAEATVSPDIKRRLVFLPRVSFTQLASGESQREFSLSFTFCNFKVSTQFRRNIKKPDYSAYTGEQSW